MAHGERFKECLGEVDGGKRMKERLIEFTINGRPRKLRVKPNDLLLNVIREAST